MKGSLTNYQKLWQKKREELSVVDNKDAGWLLIKSKLDEFLPVSEEVSKQQARPRGRLGTIPMIFIAFSVAAMVYTFSNIISLKQNKGQHELVLHHRPNVKKYTRLIGHLAAGTTKTQSTSGRSGKDEILAANQSVNTGDSIKKGSKGPGLSRMHISPNKPNRQFVNTPKLSFGGRPNAAVAARLQGVAKYAIGQVLKGHGLATLRPGSNQTVVKTNIKSHRHLFVRANVGQQDVLNNRSLNRSGVPLLQSSSYKSIIISSTAPGRLAIPFASINIRVNKIPPPGTIGSRSAKIKLNDKQGSPRPENKAAKIEWGILLGANTSGSFTPAGQNNSFYGSAPIDVYPGIFINRHINNQWSVTARLELFSPQTISTIYRHANQSVTDSPKSLTIIASRKLYSANVPIVIVYHPASIIGFEAGPVFSFPVKQINTKSLLQFSSTKSDSAYYAGVIDTLNSTKYTRQFNIGISGGVNLYLGRFIIGLDYWKSLGGYKIISGYGTYKSNSGTLQLKIGFKLDKAKK